MQNCERNDSNNKIKVFYEKVDTYKNKFSFNCLLIEFWTVLIQWFDSGFDSRYRHFDMNFLILSAMAEESFRWLISVLILAQSLRLPFTDNVFDYLPGRSCQKYSVDSDVSQIQTVSLCQWDMATILTVSCSFFRFVSCCSCRKLPAADVKMNFV